MNTSYGLSSYYSHDLNISMKTSSGDVVKLDFSNEQTLEIQGSTTSNSTSASLAYTSAQSYSFEMQSSNGIDEQDKKELQEFMKIAKPYIDDFMKELQEGSQTTPLNKAAKEIASIFEPQKERNDTLKEYTKSQISSLFDTSMSQQKSLEKILDEAKKLLEKTLEYFEQNTQELYA